MTEQIYVECMATIGRHSDAYDYAMKRLDGAVANRMIYDMQPIAGWYPLETISSSAVYERAVEPGWGQWQDFPEADDLADEAADYVASHWEGGDNCGTDWALQKFEEFAAERGIVLQPQKEAA